MPSLIKSSSNLTSSFLFDAIIIGAGPAGLSAALTLCRQKRPAVIFSDAIFCNAKADRAHTVLSRDHQPAPEIHRIGREQIEAYGTTKFVERRVRTAWHDDDAGFQVDDEEGEVWRGKKIILATGVRDVFADIEGYAECWGESIYQCMFCDGLERGDRPAAMLGFDGPMNLHSVGFMFQVGCPEVTILLNGPLKVGEVDKATSRALEVAKAKGAGVDERQIRRLVRLPGGEGIQVVFETGESMKVGFLQHTPPTDVLAPELAQGLGVEIVPDGRDGKMLKRNEPFGETNVHGVFAAGDAGTVMKQFTFAMAQGVSAGGGVCIQLGQEEDEEIARELDCAGQRLI